MNIRVVFLLISFSFAAKAQNDSIQKLLKPTFVILPNIVASPEVGLGLGVAAFYVHRIQKDIQNKPSTQGFFPLYTLKKQISIGASSDNWFNKNKDHFFINFLYNKYPFDYYQFGNFSAETSEKYNSNYLDIQGVYEHAIVKNVYAGLQYYVRNENKIQYTPNGTLDADNPIGKTDYGFLALGPSLLFDNRDNILYPNKGSLYSIKLRHTNKALSNLNNITFFNIDLRQYISVYNKHILAINYLFNSTSTIQTPFQLMPNIGGPYIQRGIIQSRWKDKMMHALQVDYRFPIYKKIKGLAFVNAGSVAPNFSSLITTKKHFGYGLGVRYAMGKENFIIRADIGFGQTTSPYIDVNEAF